MILGLCGKYEHAGQVPYQLWADSGVKVPIFTETGTLTDPANNELIPEVAEGLNAIADYFDHIGLVTDYEHLSIVSSVREELADELGVEVVTIGLDRDYKQMANRDTALTIAALFDIEPSTLGVVGSKFLIDPTFGLGLGARALAICSRPLGFGFNGDVSRFEQLYRASDSADE